MFNRYFGRPKKEIPYTAEQRLKDIVKYKGLSLTGTTKRETANVRGTAAQGIAAGLGIAVAAKVAATTAIAGTIAIPPLIPVMLAVLVATTYILRQKGLNEELRANLYFIKMEIERMMRSINVIKEIAEARGIQLNTISLTGVITGLKDKIALFASKQTAIDIKNLELSLAKGESLVKVKQELADIAVEGDKAMISAETQSQIDTDRQVASIIHQTQNEPQPQPQPKSFVQGTPVAVGGWRPNFSKLRQYWPTGWIARWLSPSESLRQIIRDVTIATVWYSIMLSEFDIFMRYQDIKQVPMPIDWASGDHMKSLLIANRELSGTKPQYSNFYNLTKLEGDRLNREITAESATSQLGGPPSELSLANERDLLEALKLAGNAASPETQARTALGVVEEQQATSSSPESSSGGGRRRTQAHKKARTHRKRTHKRHST
jgi:hypothetical protein